MKAENLNLKEYFEKFFFDIPIFQRKYVWKESEIDEIYNDFDTCWSIKENPNIFLGSIFLLSEGKWNLIIDGQQRTIFLYILFTFFKDFIENIKKINQKKIDDFLNNSPDDQKILYNDILDWYEKDFNLIQIKYHDDELIWNSQKKAFFLKNKEFTQMTKQFDYLRKKLEKMDVKNIISISNFILHKVNITLNLIDNSDSINDIFESINSKGKKLTTLDLLRNDFFKEDINFLNKLDNILECGKINSVKDIENILSVFIAVDKGIFFSKNLIYKELKKILYNDKTKIKDLLEMISFYNNFLLESLNEKNYLKKWIFLIAKKFNLIQFQKLFLLYIWTNENESDYNFVKKILLSMIYFINFENNRANEIEKLMLSKNNSFINDFLKNNEINIKKINFWFDLNFENFINLEEFSEDKKILHLFYFLNIKEIDNAKYWWDIVTKNEFEHVTPKSSNEKYNYKWVEKIGNIIFYNSKKNKKASNLEYKEKLYKYYNDPNGKNNIQYKGSKGDPVYIMYDYITEKKGEIWNYEIVKKRTEEILNNIKLNFINSFLNFNYSEKNLFKPIINEL